MPRRYGVEDVLRAATIGGAINSGRQDEVGTIKVGRRTDLVLIALDEVTTRLCGSDVAGRRQLRGAAAVDTVFIDGRVKKWGGELVGVDYAELAPRG